MRLCGSISDPPCRKGESACSPTSALRGQTHRSAPTRWPKYLEIEGVDYFIACHPERVLPIIRRTTEGSRRDSSSFQGRIQNDSYELEGLGERRDAKCCVSTRWPKYWGILGGWRLLLPGWDRNSRPHPDPLPCGGRGNWEVQRDHPLAGELGVSPNLRNSLPQNPSK